MDCTTDWMRRFDNYCHSLEQGELTEEQSNEILDNLRCELNWLRAQKLVEFVEEIIECEQQMDAFLSNANGEQHDVVLLQKIKQLEEENRVLREAKQDCQSRNVDLEEQIDSMKASRAKIERDRDWYASLFKANNQRAEIAEREAQGLYDRIAALENLTGKVDTDAAIKATINNLQKKIRDLQIENDALYRRISGEGLF